MKNVFLCPVCGEEVKVGAASCPECGACDETGWREDAENSSVYNGLDLPDDDFDYEGFVRRELEGKKDKSSKEWFLAVVAILVIVTLLLIYIL